MPCSRSLQYTTIVWDAAQPPPNHRHAAPACWVSEGLVYATVVQVILRYCNLFRKWNYCPTAVLLPPRARMYMCDLLQTRKKSSICWKDALRELIRSMRDHSCKRAPIILVKSACVKCKLNNHAHTRKEVDTRCPMLSNGHSFTATENKRRHRWLKVQSISVPRSAAHSPLLFL